MCAALRCVEGGAQSWWPGLAMELELEAGAEPEPTFACWVSSGVQQEFNYTFDFNENTTSVLRRIYPVEG